MRHEGVAAVYIDGQTVHYTPSTLVAFDRCGYGLLRDLDRRLGRIPDVAPNRPPDPMRERIRELADQQEGRLRDSYVARFGRYDGSGGGVLDVPTDLPDGRRTADWTAALLRGEQPTPDVIARPVLRSGRFSAGRDFLVRRDGRWQPSLSRFARRVKASAVISIGAKAVLLRELEVPVVDEAIVLLGDGSEATVPVDEARERVIELAGRLEATIDEHVRRGEPVRWAEDVPACGWCEECRLAAALTRDVRTVAGVRMEHRALLRAAGLQTIDALAASSVTEVDGLDPEQLASFRAQARLQVIQTPPGAERDPSLHGPIVHEVIDPAAIRALPPADPGDIFFDFESDPMWTEDGIDLGLEYLFGMWLPADEPSYAAFWAHDRAAERAALIGFLDFVRERRRRHPGLHIYHYAAYETVVLRRAAQRHEVGADEVDAWIAEGLFVDLLPVVRASIRISQEGYGLKKIEPLYLDAGEREGEVTTAASSVVQYHRLGELRAAGDDAGADVLLAELAAYNRADCLSTYRLREWLLALAA